MPIVPINVLVASIAVCTVHNAVASLGQQAAFAAEQTRAGCQLIIISHFSFNDAVQPQSFYPKGNEIALSIRNLLIDAAVAAFLVASSIGPAPAQTVDHSHDAELPQMLAEHRSIVDALNRLREAAGQAGRDDVVAFAAALVEHAQSEEEVMYPAAILLGQVVR